MSTQEKKDNELGYWQALQGVPSSIETPTIAYQEGYKLGKQLRKEQYKELGYNQVSSPLRWMDACTTAKRFSIGETSPVKPTNA